MGYYNDFLSVLPKLKVIANQAENVVLENDESLEVYNPFNYGIECYLKYLEQKFSQCWPCRIVIGLNPGLDGAVQTCVPFTDVYSCKNRLGIDPTAYMKKYKNVVPEKYIYRSAEPSANIFYEALEEENYLADFLSTMLLLNAFPIGMSKETVIKKVGGFFAKNVTPNDFKGDFSKKMNDLSEDYLRVVLNGLYVCNIVALGRYPSDRLKKLGIKHNYLIHPSPIALRTQKISREKWKQDIITLIR
ncbi:hypothetical protein LN736_13920 [Clostridium sp. WLY-B-L2]|uniref:Uracil DNA glycosylase superfamily protein n=1 Tax=Clostridium aromativorans TaxID=2836848 RepID=A0ABS8N819_9CLOT|nr:hypothetical protein [Clostridium aromativorans]MCC9295959.1 hypothetical protein [Clostridium aromativorans]